jgi:hypothetical protein
MQMSRQVMKGAQLLISRHTGQLNPTIGLGQMK